MVKNIIFDLDGTLADSISDIYNCVNTSLKHFNLQTISIEDTHKFVGNGAKLLIKRVSSQYEIDSPTLYGKLLAVLDYISGMTDVYALDLYRKINGNSLPSV